MEELYVLQLANGKYYVGKSTDVNRRYQEHVSGNGSAWTSLHKPKRILEIRSLKDEHDETNTTKELMKKYGIENVRGGAYTQVTLPSFVEQTLELEMKSSQDACFKCGEIGHFAKDCDSDEEEEEVVVWECEHCNRQFNSENACFRHETQCGGQLSYRKTKGSCYRCGRTSHYADNCFANTHVKGYTLY